ncbi:MAG: hypothetical protein Q9222_002086 [Ikaeria aurantiellina]
MRRGGYRGRFPNNRGQYNGPRTTHENTKRFMHGDASNGPDNMNIDDGVSIRGRGRGQSRGQDRGQDRGQGRGRGQRGDFHARGRGFRIRGNGRGNPNYAGNDPHTERPDRNELVKIVVSGLLESDVAYEGDNGMAKCREWLELRARNGSRKPIEYVNIKSPRWENDDMVFEVRSSDVWRILKSDGQQFHNVILSVQRADGRNQNFQVSRGLPPQHAEILEAVLSSRYDAGNKILELEKLEDDPQLREIGTWDPASTISRSTDVFTQLMRLCQSEDMFASRDIKAERVESVSLANNNLTNMSPVFELTKAFPDIRNLDLSNNRIMDVQSLIPFLSRFKRLNWLILSPNPIESNDPDYQLKIVKRFPMLGTLNSTKISTDDAAAITSLGHDLPFATIKDNFQDQAGIAESAIRDLILGTDSDRSALVRKLYDDESTFSLSYNPSAPRSNTAKPAGWEPHLKQSRNLKKVFQLEPRIRRLAKGITEIENAFKLLPPTRHPDLVNESLQYSFDCTPVPGVPDPQNQNNASGVGGFKVDVRGSFDEFDALTGVKTATRSFDRVFILGPGVGGNPLRIISDILMLRAEGGHEAFISTGAEPVATNVPSVSASLNVPSLAPANVPSVTVAAPAVNVQPAEEEDPRVAMVSEVSKATGLQLKWAETLLNDSGWDFQTALQNFKTARANGVLQNEYFIPEAYAPAASNPTGIFY